MKTFKKYLLLFWISTCVEAIKYELAITTPDHKYEKPVYDKEVITSAKRGFSITILSDVPILAKGMLDISPDTYYFWLDGRNLEKIEPGAFDNQNITVEIRLEYNNLTSILTGTFKNLRITKLDLSYNKITHLEEGAISDLPNLSEVNLSRNRFKSFDPNGLRNTPKLRDFHLSYNNLTELGEKWFPFMSKDKAVIVGASYNDIENINPKALEGIKVWNLGLEHNKIKEIPPEVFKENDIQYLYIADNKLEDLPQEFFDLKNLSLVDVMKNPLRPDVQEKLKKFAEENRFQLLLRDDDELKRYIFK